MKDKIKKIFIVGLSEIGILISIGIILSFLYVLSTYGSMIVNPIVIGLSRILDYIFKIAMNICNDNETAVMLLILSFFLFMGGNVLVLSYLSDKWNTENHRKNNEVM
jgi:hypothetical protein